MTQEPTSFTPYIQFAPEIPPKGYIRQFDLSDKPRTKDYDFDALMAQFETMVGDLMGKDQTYYSPRITQIIEKYLGKGKKMATVNRNQAELVYLIVDELKETLIKQ